MPRTRAYPWQPEQRIAPATSPQHNTTRTTTNRAHHSTACTARFLTPADECYRQSRQRAKELITCVSYQNKTMTGKCYQNKTFKHSFIHSFILPMHATGIYGHHITYNIVLFVWPSLPSSIHHHRHPSIHPSHHRQLLVCFVRTYTTRVDVYAHLNHPSFTHFLSFFMHACMCVCRVRVCLCARVFVCLIVRDA